MAGVLYQAGDAYYPRAPDHTSVYFGIVNVKRAFEFGFMIWVL